MRKLAATLCVGACLCAGTPGSAQILPKDNQSPNPPAAGVPRNAPPPLGQTTKPTAPNDQHGQAGPPPSATSPTTKSTASDDQKAAPSKGAASNQMPPKASGQSPAQASANANGTNAAGNDGPDGPGYPMKNGGTYKPPTHRPTSPAQDFSIYGRT